MYVPILIGYYITSVMSYAGLAFAFWVILLL